MVDNNQGNDDDPCGHRKRADHDDRQEEEQHENPASKRARRTAVVPSQRTTLTRVPSTVSQRSELGRLFSGFNDRAYPGNPPKERYGRAYNMPYSELNQRQRLVARNVLNIQDEEAWELAMPRRVYQHGPSIVLQFQSKTWSQLSWEHQILVEDYLHISETFWNQTLCPLHDDLHTIDGITLTAKEFDAVLPMIQRMSEKSILSRKELAQFLLSLERLMLPSQGVKIAEELKRSSSWGNLFNDSIGRDVTPHLIIASFLSFPQVFVDIPYLQLLPYWDDDNGGCTWGNASDPHHQQEQEEQGLKPYAAILRQRFHRRCQRIEVWHCVFPILTGKSTPHDAGVTSHLLPSLPVEIANYIFDDMLGGIEGNESPIDPQNVSWLRAYGKSLSNLF